ncbi:MAG: Geranylgeranylglyceryl phosphate synthase-like protein (pcrB) [Cenarchaeum symbiont of Oopsacas minuta]|nr:Geranylgeranylglyceryl phosphate synthase-like protein (pcrB) [Cenarchaeum symbiont of Oopsacas minuta]
MVVGSVEKRLSDLKKKRCLVFVLIDSEIANVSMSVDLAKSSEIAGASAILVGGSTSTDQMGIAETVKKLKKVVKIPIILFPGNITGVVPNADAILFSSLLNSENPYYISQAQALGAPNVIRLGLESLPTAYLIIGEGTAAWFVGNAKGIPFEKPSIAAAYSMAARCLGMRFVYLEAGSGASESVRPDMVKMVRKVFDGFLIVGGGIRDAKGAKKIADAGADAIVLGTILEKKDKSNKLVDIIKTVNRSKR